jgi:hypothetical protein
VNVYTILLEEKIIVATPTYDDQDADKNTNEKFGLKFVGVGLHPAKNRGVYFKDAADKLNPTTAFYHSHTFTF